jgi:hypothetical protein
MYATAADAPVRRPRHSLLVVEEDAVGTGGPNTTARFVNGWTPGSAKRFAKYSWLYVAAVALWLAVMTLESERTGAMLLARGVLLSEMADAERACMAHEEKVVGLYHDLKNELKHIRRTKNGDAIVYKKVETDCYQKLKEIEDKGIKRRNFEIASLTAKTLGNHTLINQYRLVEAVAKVQDRWDHAEALWKLNKSFDDLRNTLVVELSQLLSVSIESLQALQAIELVQRVEEL